MCTTEIERKSQTEFIQRNLSAPRAHFGWFYARWVCVCKCLVLLGEREFWIFLFEFYSRFTACARLRRTWVSRASATINSFIFNYIFFVQLWRFSIAFFCSLSFSKCKVKYNFVFFVHTAFWSNYSLYLCKWTHDTMWTLNRKNCF